MGLMKKLKDLGLGFYPLMLHGHEIILDKSEIYIVVIYILDSTHRPMFTWNIFGETEGYAEISKFALSEWFLKCQHGWHHHILDWDNSLDGEGVKYFGYFVLRGRLNLL